MDALSDVLTRARAHGAVFSILARREPWGLAFSGARPLVLHFLLRGHAVLRRAAAAIPVDAGDVVLVRAGDPYRIGSAVDAPYEPIERARAEASGPAHAQADALVLCGGYTIEGAPGAALLRSLPDVLVVPAQEQSRELGLLVQILGGEAGRKVPGQQTVLDRALDLLLVQSLRDASASRIWDAPGWYRALEDPALAAILDAVHAAPERPWTVASMAEVAHLSRAGFARRFAELVGETPAAYVSRLRVERAGDLLLTTDGTVAAVAADVGFGSEFSFADAFKRQHGTTPGRWRRERR
jgi:AraC-like DNA-binding protein